MLDTRIYRTGLTAVVLAVIVVGFSLGDQQAPLGTTLVPDAFNGQNAYATMQALAAEYPGRRPGSVTDSALAAHVADALHMDGFLVSTTSFRAQTADGPRRLETVTGTLAGQSTGSIVIVAHRDPLGAPGTSDLSGTAVLLELARVVSNETQHRSIVMASTSGSAGSAGDRELAAELPGPVDAVIVLGDLAGSSVRLPVVVPWSNSRLVAPTMLRNTVAAALGQQAGVRAGGDSLGGQFLHVALPMALSQQAPFGGRGEPAVLLSTAGERAAANGEQTSPDRLTAFGRTMLQSLSALDAGPQVPAPSAYLLYSGKVIPGWAIRLLVLACILPVLVATIDGLARVRRRGHVTWRWLLWVVSASAPFALPVLAVLAIKRVGLLGPAPPGPVVSQAVSLHGRQIAILAVLASVIVVALVTWVVLAARLAGPALGAVRRRSRGGADGAPARRPNGARNGAAAEGFRPPAAAALLLVLSGVSIALWLGNPFAAALVVPALHLWLWIVAPEARLRVPFVVLLFVAGLAPLALAVLYYAVTLGLSPLATAWNAVLILAGGEVGLPAALEWSVVLGCVVSLAVIALLSACETHPEEAPITMRGPITYAGPGSLGGTRSAMRR